MKNLYDAWLIQIDITNSCINKCAHCTRAVPHFLKPYFSDLAFVEKALQSLKGWKGGVGCIGGEPTLHPQFPEICALYTKYFPKKQCGLFTCGGPKFKQYKSLIEETFGIIAYNEHTLPTFHQPMLVASEEVIPDEQLRNELIDHCWVQQMRCPSITVKGAFFCEVAATLDLLFDGPGGYPLEAEWWKKSVHQFQDQRDAYCKLCSMAIPMITLPDNVGYELVSKGNAERLKDSPWSKQQKLKIVETTFTRDDLKKIQNDPAYRPPEFNKIEYNDHIWTTRIPFSYRVKKLITSLFTGSLKRIVIWKIKHIWTKNT